MRSQWRRRLNPDPVALRRGGRAALVIPVALLIARFGVADPQALIFVVFGCFALLVMADFGGPRRTRVVAYLATMFVGAALVALGTIVSATASGAGIAMLLIGFGLAFAGFVGGYVTGAQTGLLLAFVISVSLPAPTSAIPGRVGGWMLAGLISTIAAAFLWPRPERDDLPDRAASAVLAVADLLERNAPTPLAPVREAVDAARSEYSGAARRPAGLNRSDRAYFEMFSELDQIIDLVEIPFQSPKAMARPCIAEGTRLTAGMLEAMRSSAAVLKGGAAPDLRAVDEAWRAHRVALDSWVVDQLRAGRPAAEVLDGVDYDHTLRVMSYLAIGLAGNAVIAAGGDPESAIPLPAAIPRRPGVGGVSVRVVRSIRAHLQPQSPVLHNSLRLAIGLAVSVFLARTLGFSHAFWVVLGTLQVLRTSVLGTGRTTVQALAGTAIGVAVGGLFAALAGSDPLLMWSVLPITVFLAAYAATTVGFVLGQAAFSVNLIVVFNLISPAGWQVGLVRIEDVAVGAAVSIVAGVLLWPRGARQELARSVASFYRTLAAYLGPAFDQVLGFEVAGEFDGLRREAVRARDRAGEGLQLLLAERGTKHLEQETAAALVIAGNQGMLGADALTVVATDLGYRAMACADGAAAIRTEVKALQGQLTNLADRLVADRDTDEMTKPVSLPAMRAAALGCLDRTTHDPSTQRSALALVVAEEWAQNLARLATVMEQPVSAAVAAARIPWWR
jgi:uncharacterized membrane protein YccC